MQNRSLNRKSFILIFRQLEYVVSGIFGSSAAWSSWIYQLIKKFCRRRHSWWTSYIWGCLSRFRIIFHATASSIGLQPFHVLLKTLPTDVTRYIDDLHVDLYTNMFNAIDWVVPFHPSLFRRIPSRVPMLLLYIAFMSLELHNLLRSSVLQINVECCTTTKFC